MKLGQDLSINSTKIFLCWYNLLMVSSIREDNSYICSLYISFRKKLGKNECKFQDNPIDLRNDDMIFITFFYAIKLMPF